MQNETYGEKICDMNIMPYPRFISAAVENLFIHWLQFSTHHENQVLKDTMFVCPDCNIIKDILDAGVMKQLNSLLQGWEKKLRGSNISSLLVGYMSEEQARYMYRNIAPIQYTTDENQSGDVGKTRINQMLDVYFNSITNRDLLQIGDTSGNYLPFIIHCDVQFKTLAVRYNDILTTNDSEIWYYKAIFVMLAFNLGGLFAFPPAFITFLWAALYPETLIAWFYLKGLNNGMF